MEVFDYNAVPSGNGMAAFVLLRLAGLAVEPRYAELARCSLGPMQPLLALYPLGFGQWSRWAALTPRPPPCRCCRDTVRSKGAPRPTSALTLPAALRPPTRRRCGHCSNKECNR